LNISTENFRQHFELLSDEALEAVNREELVELARACYDEEIARRGLGRKATEPATEGVEVELPEQHGNEDLISLTTFTLLEEARLARGLLESAGIPAFLANERANLGVLHLMVPRGSAEQALGILDGGGISEEDLAAQAEAAGFEEMDEEGERER